MVDMHKFIKKSLRLEVYNVNVNIYVLFCKFICIKTLGIKYF